MLLSGTASRINRTSHGLFCWLVAPTVREVFQIPCMSDTNLLSGKQAEKWNVVLLVMPQGLSSADPEPEDAHRPCCQSGFGCKSKTEHFSMWAILHAKRGRGVCVCACLCVQRRKFFFYLKYDSSHTQRNLSCLLSVQYNNWTHSLHVTGLLLTVCHPSVPVSRQYM